LNFTLSGFDLPLSGFDFTLPGFEFTQETSHMRHLRKMRDMWVAVGHRVQRKGKESSFYVIDEVSRKA
jgi:hypothetical protein